MKKYFIISDVHSFATIMKNSLKKNGYNKKNPDHILIVCGDIFDRGTETMKVYKFLKSIPKSRCILIRGNHESLYFDLLKKYYPDPHDFSNGTVQTFAQIAGYDLDAVYDLRLGDSQGLSSMFGDKYEMDPKYLDLWRDIKKKVQESEVTKWLQSKQWVNYYELDKYIFVHSFIPLTYAGERALSEEYCLYYGWVQYFEFEENWRDASDDEWEKSSWGCPYKFFDAGLFDKEKENGKILVCGHYRCSEFNERYLNDFSDNHDIYFGENLIAIDATTAWSNKVNVLVIEDGICYSNNTKLEIKKPKFDLPKIETVTVKPEEGE